ncbi:MAG TPA: tetratricopeptide repeat protein [Kofleriaceae bacterium]|nr:tetratricopeptide repeat protein [Kofleriaceae bacterium]
MRVLLRLVLLGSILTVGPVRVLAEPALAADKAKEKVARQYVDAGIAAQNSGDYDTAIIFYSKAFELVPRPVLMFNMAQAHRLAGRNDQALELYARYLARDPKGSQAQTASDLVDDIGLAAQNGGDYDTAIALYTKAYGLVPHPVLMFNMAEAHRLAGRSDKALALYAKYLAQDPKGAKAQTARDLIADIQARQVEEAHKADEARRAEQARQADQARRAREAEEGKVDQKRVAEPASRAQDPARPEASDQAPGRSLRLSGIAAGGAGVVALGMGIGFGLHARALSNELSQPGGTFSQDKVNSGERANTIAITGMIGGTVLVAAGATLYWLGHTQGQHQEGVTFAPVVSNQLAGVAVIGTLP